METRLRLLMRDGALGLRFRPRLTAEQYDALLKAAQLCDTRADLREAAKQLAIDWRGQVVVEE
jgi:hypothetical protein